MFNKHLSKSIAALPLVIGVTCAQRYNERSFAEPKALNLKPNYAIYERHKMVIIPGRASEKLTKTICDELDIDVGRIKTQSFSDGEVYPDIQESIRGKHVFIVQTCAPPVNSNIMELLLTITAARRSGAATVTAIVPYFGYRHHRRGLPISTTYHSRFLWSAAADFAKMLAAVGVDSVISVDLQRPGQGHEACFFNAQLPVETVSANTDLVDYFVNHVKLESPVVVVSPNTECVKKAQKFQKRLKAVSNLKNVEYAAFLPNTQPSYSREAVTALDTIHAVVADESEFLGDVRGSDVIIIDDMIESAQTATVLSRRLLQHGARRVFVGASHGLFSNSSMKLIDDSPIEKIVVTDTVTLPKVRSSKIEQVSVAPLLARIISAESFRAGGFIEDVSDAEFYELE